MSDTWNLFKTLIMVQAFYAFAITGMVHALPDDTLNYFDPFEDLGNSISVGDLTADLQDSLQRQKNIPLVELGALVFYSGNIVIDLIFNFMYAIPEMLALLINGLMMLFNIDSYVFAIVQGFTSVVITALYILGLIELITNIRSGRSIT